MVSFSISLTVTLGYFSDKYSCAFVGKSVTERLFVQQEKAAIATKQKGINNFFIILPHFFNNKIPRGETFLNNIFKSMLSVIRKTLT